jgi:RNA polymerase sigma factor (sigma-70 family)
LPEIDDTLIEKALQGDQQAFTELVSRHKESVFHVVLRIVRNREAAADLVQETFMKAFSSLHTYRSEYRFSTWLYKIAANASIDYLRKKRIKALSLDSNIETDDGTVNLEIADDRPHPDEQLVRQEQRMSIFEAIESLPDKYRRVIVARHQEEKSYEEIAAELHIPVGTVKARIFRARELLKKKLRGIA